MTVPEPAAKPFAMAASIAAAAAVIVVILAAMLIGSTSSPPRVARAATATPTPTPTATPTPTPTATATATATAFATSSSASVPPATAATQVVRYSPYVAGKLSPDLTVSATDTAADCTAVLHDPWPLRCMSSGVTQPIYDPCFPTDDATSCLFVESPTSTTAVRVALAAPESMAIPSPPATWPGYSAATPWAIELSDSTVCVFVDGAEDNVDGLRPQDRCSDGRYLFGDPDETATVWNVKVGASQSGPLTGTATIAKVWIFGH